MRRSTALTLVASVLLSLTGCKSPCRELSERLCDCVETFQRDTCIRTVATKETEIDVTDTELATCEEKLKSCTIDANDKTTCNILLTDEGKQACGLAR